MAVFFTSDTHFGHEAIIRLSDRPFSSVEAMDAALIAQWNATVAPGDTVYHLGDFCFRNSSRAADYLKQLNGEVHLIAGNHDKETLRVDPNIFASVSPIKDLRVDGLRIILCHYPLREWQAARKGSWHLFGHLHGRLNHQPIGYSMDVGVDSNPFRPWGINEIAAIFAERENPFARPSEPPVKRTIRAL